MFICCGGSTASEHGGDGAPSGSAGAGGTGGAGGNVSDGGAGCPARIPSGPCGNNPSTCNYVDDQGCPQSYICFSQFPQQPGNWTTVTPNPGGSCTTTGQVCGYTEAVGDNLPMHTDLECTASGQWQVKDPCPPTRPAQGAPCTNFNTACPYGVGCTAVCVGPGGSWLLEGCPDAGG